MSPKRPHRPPPTFHAHFCPQNSRQGGPKSQMDFPDRGTLRAVSGSPTTPPRKDPFWAKSPMTPERTCQRSRTRSFSGPCRVRWGGCSRAGAASKMGRKKNADGPRAPNRGRCYRRTHPEDPQSGSASTVLAIRGSGSGAGLHAWSA